MSENRNALSFCRRGLSESGIISHRTVVATALILSLGGQAQLLGAGTLHEIFADDASLVTFPALQLGCELRSCFPGFEKADESSETRIDVEFLSTEAGELLQIELPRFSDLSCHGCYRDVGEKETSESDRFLVASHHPATIFGATPNKGLISGEQAILKIRQEFRTTEGGAHLSRSRSSLARPFRRISISVKVATEVAQTPVEGVTVNTYEALIYPEAYSPVPITRGIDGVYFVTPLFLTFYWPDTLHHLPFDFTFLQGVETLTLSNTVGTDLSFMTLENETTPVIRQRSAGSQKFPLPQGYAGDFDRLTVFSRGRAVDQVNPGSLSPPGTPELELKNPIGVKVEARKPQASDLNEYTGGNFERRVQCDVAFAESMFHRWYVGIEFDLSFGPDHENYRTCGSILDDPLRPSPEESFEIYYTTHSYSEFCRDEGSAITLRGYSTPASLAHELGHAIALHHSTGQGNLMTQGNSSPTWLSLGQAYWATIHGASNASQGVSFRTCCPDNLAVSPCPFPVCDPGDTCPGESQTSYCPSQEYDWREDFEGMLTTAGTGGDSCLVLNPGDTTQQLNCLVEQLSDWLNCFDCSETHLEELWRSINLYLQPQGLIPTNEVTDFLSATFSGGPSAAALLDYENYLTEFFVNMLDPNGRCPISPPGVPSRVELQAIFLNQYSSSVQLQAFVALYHLVQDEQRLQDIVEGANLHDWLHKHLEELLNHLKTEYPKSW